MESLTRSAVGWAHREPGHEHGMRAVGAEGLGSQVPQRGARGRDAEEHITATEASRWQCSAEQGQRISHEARLRARSRTQS